MEFTDQLRAEYRHLFQTARVRPERQALVDQTVRSLVAHRDRYEQVGDPIEVPWWFVAVIHQMEGSRNFHTHLHNGDPLTHRTVRVPRNRPPGNPPFTFEESARVTRAIHEAVVAQLKANPSASNYEIARGAVMDRSASIAFRMGARSREKIAPVSA